MLRENRSEGVVLGVGYMISKWKKRSIIKGRKKILVVSLEGQRQFGEKMYVENQCPELDWELDYKIVFSRVVWNYS